MSWTLFFQIALLILVCGIVLGTVKVRRCHIKFIVGAVIGAGVVYVVLALLLSYLDYIHFTL